MDTNENVKPIEQLPEFVEKVQLLVVEVQDVLRGLPKLVKSQESTDSLRSLLELHVDKEQEIAVVNNVFLEWNSTELPAYEKSEVVRALGLLKRAQLVVLNILRLLKERLGIADPERAQKELQMQLQSMGVIHGGPR